MSEEREPYDTDSAIDEIEQRALASTAGTFKVDDRGTIYRRPEDAGIDDPSEFYAEIFGPGFKDWPKNKDVAANDARFYANARADVLALAAEVRRLRADVERIGQERDRMAAAGEELNSRLTLCEGAKQ